MRDEARPFSDPAVWLEGALQLLALRLRHEVALTRALRGEDRREQFLGLFLSDAEAEAMLDEMSGRLAAAGGVPALDAVMAAWHDHAALRRREPLGIWPRLAQVFGLSEAELDLLVLAAAPALDPRFGRAYGYLGEDVTRRHLTPALAHRLLPHRLDALTLRRMLAPAAPLRLFALLRLDEAAPRIEAPLGIDEEVVDLLLGAPPRPPGPVLPLGQGGETGAVIVTAGTPDAISTAVLDLGEARGWALCLLPEDGRSDLLAARIRAARLAGAVPVVPDPAAGAPERAALAPLLAEGAVLITPDAQPWQEAGLRADQIDPVACERRHAVWKARLLGSATLTQARHADLLRLARSKARDPRPDALRHSAEAQATAALTQHARRIATRQGMEDLVLPRPTRAALERLIDWQTHGAQVLGDWGLGALFGKSRGTVALFKGPSGTGKTMAAAILGARLGLPVFRVDLAAMVSKYIGETEKNLERLFRAAEGSDALLFFDEADSLFGQRSEVSDAHDRYANLETSYLLQRLESFDGLSILATNLAQNLDAAFLRRFDHVIEFPMPGPDLRRALWERGLRSAAPIAADLDLGALAERFEMTGAEIRNCWLDAAHRAAARGSAVGMELILQAVAAELLKQGKVLKKADFGSHYVRARGGAG